MFINLFLENSSTLVVICYPVYWQLEIYEQLSVVFNLFNKGPSFASLKLESHFVFRYQYFVRLYLFS